MKVVCSLAGLVLACEAGGTPRGGYGARLNLECLAVGDEEIEEECEGTLVCEPEDDVQWDPGHVNVCDEIEPCSCVLNDDEPGPNEGDVFGCPAWRELTYCHENSGLCNRCRGDEDDNDKHFDCDDYALVCAMWGNQHGVNVCQMSFEWDYVKPRERSCREGDCKRTWTSTGGAHVINIVEFDDEYCLIEPQRDPDRDKDGDGEPDHQKICCWPKGPDSKIDEPPRECILDACADVGGKRDEDCKVRDIWCEPTHSPNAGEKPFWVNPEMCRLVGETCDIEVDPPVCDCDHAEGREERLAQGWECIEDSCRFLNSGPVNDPVQKCYCDWRMGGPTGDPIPE